MDSIRKIYLYRALASFTFIAPIFVLFLQDNGLSMTQVMSLQSIYTITMLAVSIASGSLADKIGRKTVLVLGALSQVLGYGLYSVSGSYMEFLLCEILLGTSMACWDSTYSAFIYDTLKENDRIKDYKKVFGNVFALLFLSTGIAAPIGSLLGSHDLRWPFYLSILPSLIAIIIVLRLKEPAFTKSSGEYISHVRNTLGYCWSIKRIRYLILFGSVTYSALFSAFFLYQPYYEAAGLPIAYFGIMYFFLELMTAAGAKYADSFERWLSERKYLLLIAVLPFIGLIIMAYNPVIGIATTLVLGVVSGLLEPALTDYINERAESYHRATVISVYGTSFGLFSSIMLIIVGRIVDTAGMSAALLSLAGLLSVNFLVLFGLRNNDK